MKQKLIILICAVLLLTACGRGSDSKPQDYGALEYESVYVIYPDNFRIHSVTEKMDVTGIGNRTYGFQPDISDEERQACIEATETTLARIGFDGKVSVYIYTGEALNNSYYIDEDGDTVSLFASVTDWRGADYVTELLLTACGRYCNYGAAHGYAEYLCEEALKNGGNDEEAAQPVFDIGYNSYDLNLLCFDESFVTGDEVRAAEGVSNAFVREYIVNNGEAAFCELLIKSGSIETNGEFIVELEKWYDDKGLTLAEPVSGILYTSGGYSYQYIAYNGYAVFYMTRNWKDATYGSNPLVTEKFLHEDYAETKKFYEINTEQMKQYKELFKLKSDVMNVPVIIENGRESYYDGVTGTGETGEIHLRNVSSLSHEYIHALCTPTSLSYHWTVEGWARAFDMRYNYYAYDFLTLDYNDGAQNNEKLSFLKQLMEKNGRPIDMRTDSVDVNNLMIYYGQYYDPNASYVTGASFVDYLCDTYGEQKIIDYVCDNHDLTTVTDRTYEELIEDWKNYMEDTYSWCIRENEE